MEAHKTAEVKLDGRGRKKGGEGRVGARPSPISAQTHGSRFLRLLRFNNRMKMVPYLDTWYLIT